MPKTKYIWDPVDDVVVMEKDEDGATTAVYTHEPGLHGELISQRRGETTSYYHYDGLGSTVALTNESEEVTDTFRYRAYGEPVVRTGTTENPFRWVGALGYYWDEELGQYYVRARHYEPSVARWMSQDPIGYQGSMNTYWYASDNPARVVDPSGLVVVELSPPPQPPWCPDWLYEACTMMEPPKPLPPEKPHRPTKSPDEYYDKNGCCKIEIKMFCRKMPSDPSKSFLHCYLAVKNDDKWVETAGGSQSGERPNLLVLADSSFDLDHLKEGTGGSEFPFSMPKGKGKDACTFLECVLKEATKFSGTTYYNQYYNNSNTLLTRVIGKCGGTADFPWRAFGSDDIRREK